MSNFIKIETNNFEAIYVRPEDVIKFNRKCFKGCITKNIRGEETVTPDRYSVIMSLTNGEKINVFEGDNMEAADKFIENLIQTIATNMEEFLPQRFDLPNYGTDEWKNICDLPEDEEWKSC